MAYCDENEVFVPKGVGFSYANYDKSNLPDYTYKPSRYRTLDMSDDEYDEMDEWAADLYKEVEYNDIVPYKPNIDRSKRGEQLEQMLQCCDGGDNDVLWGRMKPFVLEMSPTDKADFDLHLCTKSGYMLSLLLLIADKVWGKGEQYYLDLYVGDYSPHTGLHCGENATVEYDSDDEVIPTHPQVMRYKVSAYHAQTFFHFYSGGCRNGISERVRGALYHGVSYNFDFYPWLTAIRDDWKKDFKFDSGQMKIFLGALRAFDKLSPGRITVLVIGSSSHPVRSGYTYHGLANFLTLSGFSGLMHLFDPLENHLSCQIGNFTLKYFAMEFRVGSVYQMEGDDPTVILDDVYGADEKILSDMDPTYQTVLLHGKSRVCMKHYPNRKQLKVTGITVSISSQYAYGGNEQRIYYRVPTANVVGQGQWIGNMQCAQCWHYAGLISRIGRPQEDLRPYWKIMYSMAGHHCQSVPGVRNIMLLNALRHEISRGYSKKDAIANVLDKVPRQFKMNEVALARVFTFGEKIDTGFIQKEPHYAPNYDMEMNIRDRVNVSQIVDVFVEQGAEFKVYRSIDYESRKYEKVLEMYSEVRSNSKPVMEIMLYHGGNISILDNVALVEDIRQTDLRDFDIVYQVGLIGILIRKGREMGMRILFDRGRPDERAYAIDDL